MKGFFIYRINHDVQTIIELMLFYNRMKNTNDEFRRVFYFFDVELIGNVCPNPNGRCVGRWRDVKIHWLDGKFHRKNGPAVEWHGAKRWYYKGKLHREDGPAIEYENGYKEWWINGKKIAI